MAEEIARLVELIDTSIALLTKICKENDKELPSLNSESKNYEGSYLGHSDAANAAKVAAAACMQLSATLMHPVDFVNRFAAGDMAISAFQVAQETSVAEILREAGPKGLHADVISEKCGVQSDKLARILRLLATNFVFREVEPNVFANNRISAVMDTGKSHQEIVSAPEQKFTTPSFSAIISHHLWLNGPMRVAALETLTNRELGYSSDRNKSVFCQGFKTNDSFFHFLERPENALKRRRFGLGMAAFVSQYPKDLSLRAFDWDSLPPGSLVADVGGGFGGDMLPLAEKYLSSGLRIVVQDLPGVIPDGEKVWKSRFPDAIVNGQVKLEVHDFLKPQPIKDASVFFIKHCLHNWSDPDVSTILKQLREASNSTTQLVVVDYVLPYACPLGKEGLEKYNITGGNVAPKPLLPNYGAVNEAGYMMDLLMMYYFNAKERTIMHFGELLETTGWKLAKCYPLASSSGFLHALHAVPS